MPMKNQDRHKYLKERGLYVIRESKKISKMEVYRRKVISIRVIREEIIF